MEKTPSRLDQALDDIGRKLIITDEAVLNDLPPSFFHQKMIVDTGKCSVEDQIRVATENRLRAEAEMSTTIHEDARFAFIRRAIDVFLIIFTCAVIGAHYGHIWEDVTKAYNANDTTTANAADTGKPQSSWWKDIAVELLTK